MERAIQALRDICGQKLIRQEKELHRLRELVYKDELTGLLNYRAFREGMDQRMNAGDAFGLLYLDLNRFKEVNDHFGHLAGDRMLMEVASVLITAAGPDALVYRLGGDEFAMMMAEKDMDAVRERVVLGFEQADGLKIGAFRMSASIGSATFPKDGRTYEELLGYADYWMYTDKRRRQTELRAE